MDTRQLLGKRIKELRLLKGLKQAELAELVGIEPRSISRIESGFHFPKDEHLEKFAKIFEIEIKDLFVFDHLDNIDYISAINKLLVISTDEKLKLIYRIVKTMVK